jgi:hypothetical protein
MLNLIAGLSAGIAGLCALLITLAFQLVHGEREHAAQERAHMAAERRTWAVERADLLQRIQAPEQAVIQHALNAPVPPSPPSILADDDEDHWEAQLTKEQLAERAYMQEMAEA